MVLDIRDATSDDAAACTAIYRPYVEETAITFELEAPDGDEITRRIATAQDRHAWLVLTEDDQVVGFAYATQYKPRPAYNWTAEVSIYLERGLRRTGAGRTLYAELLRRLAERDIRTAVAVIALPNAASLGLHSALGFEPIGTLRRVGWKHGDWHDVAMMQRRLGDDSDPTGQSEQEERREDET